jgi:hypothetical protein
VISLIVKNFLVYIIFSWKTLCTLILYSNRFIHLLNMFVGSIRCELNLKRTTLTSMYVINIFVNQLKNNSNINCVFYQNYLISISLGIKTLFAFFIVSKFAKSSLEQVGYFNSEKVQWCTVSLGWWPDKREQFIDIGHKLFVKIEDIQFTPQVIYTTNYFHSDNVINVYGSPDLHF